MVALVFLSFLIVLSFICGYVCGIADIGKWEAENAHRNDTGTK